MKARDIGALVVLAAGISAASGVVRLKPDATASTSGSSRITGVASVFSGTDPNLSTLRVCADPNNLPFSNNRGQGFENRLANLLATDLGTKVTYTWWAQRRGFLRNTLNARTCDVVMGMPSAADHVLTTNPYYSSTYVFVSARTRHLRLGSLDDPVLRRLRIGVQMIGDDFHNAPPAHALTRRGMIRNIVGYTVYGDYSQPNPPARIVDAVASGDVDAAVVWGPLAGYFASREPVALDIAPVSPQTDGPTLPFVYDISMAVRRNDVERRRVLDDFIARRRTAIDEILKQYGVPRTDRKPATGKVL